MSKIDADPITVAIIGGGPGGLMAAYLLEREAAVSFKIKLFERSARLGGKVLSPCFTVDPNVRYEAGAAEFYDYTQLGDDPLRELIGKLGLTVSRMRSGGEIFRGHIIRNLDDIKRKLGEAVWQTIAKFDKKARALISPADYYESDWKEDNKMPAGRQSFYEFLQGVPNDIARDYIRLMAHSDLACEPHQTNATYGLQNYLMDEPDYMALYSIDGGNERLVQKLSENIAADKRLQQPVVRVGRGKNGLYEVTSIRDGLSQTESFDYVIAALPNDSLLTVEWAGTTLRDAMNRHHQFYDHPAHYLRVTCLYDKPFWRDKIEGSFFMSDLFDGCCLYDEGGHLECDGKGVLAWLIAGEAALRLSNLDDAALIELVVGSLPEMLPPGDARLLEARVHRWLGSVNALPGGFPVRDPEACHRPEPRQHPGIFVMGDYLFDSTINGVLDSAELVVDRIAEEAQANRNRAQPLRMEASK